MEPSIPGYQTPNLLTLPDSIIIDFSDELKYIRDLMIEFYPYFSERDFYHVVRKIIDTINIEEDCHFQIADLSVHLTKEYIEPLNQASYLRINEIESMFYNTSMIIMNKIISMSGYISGIFPYRVVNIIQNCEVVFKNIKTLNQHIDVIQRPYTFTI